MTLRAVPEPGGSWESARGNVNFTRAHWNIFGHTAAILEFNVLPGIKRPFRFHSVV